MTNQTFDEFVNGLTAWKGDEHIITYYSDSDPETVLNNYKKLRVKALELGIPEAEFNRDMEETIQWLYQYELDRQPPDFYYNHTFLHNVMGDYLIKVHFIRKINGIVHIYEDGIYRPAEELLQGYMLEHVPELTDAKRREVLRYIKVSRNTPEAELSPPYLIPFKSRIYNLQTREFLDYSPKYVFLNRFPYDYKPDAPDIPLVTDTIRQIANGSDEVIELLYEAMGNCFQLVNSYRGAVMLYGANGNNGKSTLLHMITCLLGRENVSFLSLQDTAERFRLAEIYGKAANIGDDIPASCLADSSIFKSIVTGGELTAEKKGRDPFHFRPYAKMFFAMNSLPPVNDKSRAFFSRALLIPLNRDFSKEAGRDVSLKDREWTEAEMECLTRLAVEALHRLIERGDFIRPACVTSAVASYEKENNPILQFLEEYGNVAGKPTQLVYDHFGIWCQANGYRNLPSRYKFSREVESVTGYITKSARHPFFAGKCGVGKCFAPKSITDVADI